MIDEDHAQDASAPEVDPVDAASLFHATPSGLNVKWKCRRIG
jgi:hypothetical protein